MAKRRRVDGAAPPQIADAARAARASAPPQIDGAASAEVQEEPPKDETDEDEDEVWVGRTVVMTHRVAAGKRIPEVPFVVLRVRRNLKASYVLLEYTQVAGDYAGTLKTYKDVLPDRSARLSERYVSVRAELARLDFPSFVDAWSPSGAARSRSRKCTFRDLKEVLPLFTLTHLPDHFRPLLLADVGSPQAAISAILATNARPYHWDGSLLSVVCKGCTYETRDVVMLEEARLREESDAQMHRLLQCPPGGGVGSLQPHVDVGRFTLHPWQASVAARILRIMDNNEKMAATFDEDCYRGNRGHIAQPVERTVVSITVLVPQKSVVVTACTGYGKTFVACVLALRRFAFCLVHPNSTRQWTREAARVGLAAVWVDSANRLAELTGTHAPDGRPRMLVISHSIARHAKFLGATLPTPELIIVDEIHSAAQSGLSRFMSKYPGVFVVGLTATLRDAEGEVAELLGVDERVLPSSIIRVPKAAASHLAYPDASFEFVTVPLTRLERSAYTVARDVGTSLDTVRALLFPATSSRSVLSASSASSPLVGAAAGALYADKVWSTAMSVLSSANRDVTSEISRALLRSADSSAYKDEIVEKCGETLTATIYAEAGRLPVPDSRDRPSVTRSRLDSAWAHRRRVLGAYSFVSKTLQSLDATQTAKVVECPICYDATSAFLLSSCGHFLCALCHGNLREAAVCPICRAPCVGGWRTLTDIRRQADEEAAEAASHGEAEAPPDTEARQAAQRSGNGGGNETSGKMAKLLDIVTGLGLTERVLVVCPLRSLLQDVRLELRSKSGHDLAVLSGSTTELQSVLRRWQKGSHSKGLLSDPDIPALTLSEVTHVVFLSPRVTDRQFVQACGRAIRQGSDCIQSGKPVRVTVLGAEGTPESTDLPRIARFRRIALDLADGIVPDSCSPLTGFHGYEQAGAAGRDEDANPSSSLPGDAAGAGGSGGSGGSGIIALPVSSSP
jgi:hypothetical protein